MNIRNNDFHNFDRFSALSGFNNILNVWTNINTNTTNATIHTHRFMIEYSNGMSLFANIAVPISDKLVALAVSTSSWLQYILSTNCFAHIIKIIDIAVHHIIVHAFFIPFESVIIDTDFAASIKNNIHKDKYMMIFMKG